MLRRFNDLKLFYKMFLGFGLLLLILGIQQYISYRGMNELSDISKELYEQKIQAIMKLNSITSLLKEVRINLFKYLGSKDPKEMDAIKMEILKGMNDIRNCTCDKAQQKLIVDNEKTAKTVESVCKLVEKSLAENEKIIALHNDFMTKQAYEAINGESQKDFDAIIALMNEMAREKNNTAAEFFKKGVARKDESVNFQLFFCFFGVIVGTGFLFAVISAVARRMKALTVAADRISIGDIDFDMDGATSMDEVGTLAKAMATMAENIRKQARATQAIARGDCSVTLVERSANDIQNRGINMVSTTVRNLTGEIKGLSGALLSGDLDRRGDAAKFEGGYREIVDGFNETLDVVIQPMIDNIFKIMNVAKAYSEGDFSVTLEKMPGKLAFANDTMDRVRENLRNLVEEMTALAKASVTGKLDARGNVDRFKGGYREIVAGVNGTLDAVIRPVNAVRGCLEEIAAGNLTVEVTGDFQGDHAILKDTLNRTIAAMNDILGQVALVVGQVNQGAKQVSDASGALSQAASEQASALEEISASMQEINSQSGHTSDSATEANNLAKSSRGAAEGGSSKMREMLEAMREINESAAGISKIIKSIDEIAFQTNLLALNAAVEAARAGKHGKGFTVVAEEVRNLAQRSARAAKETADMIEASIKKANDGTKIANDTASSLAGIVSGVTRVTDLIGEIAAASKEQRTGIAQVNQGLSHVDQVTQQNTATAEESAAASVELSARAEELSDVLKKFRLRGVSAGVEAYVAGAGARNDGQAAGPRPKMRLIR